MQVDDPNENPITYQRGLCPPEVLEDLKRSAAPPSDRFFRVAAGLAAWTALEREVIDADPDLQEYERQMIAQVKAIYGLEEQPVAKMDAIARIRAAGGRARRQISKQILAAATAVQEWSIAPPPGMSVFLADAPVAHYSFVGDEMTVRLYPGPNPAEMKWTIQFVEPRPVGTIQLFANNAEIPVDSYDGEYATIYFPELHAHFRQKGTLLVRASSE